jgi:CRISPR-associated endonuclease Csy4
MEYYQEITLLPCAEVSLAFLWTKVFTQLHIAFADEKNKSGHNPYAVSFPEYRETGLGEKIRVFAEAQELERLNLSKVLGRLLDYVHCTSIRKVSERKLRGYAVYSRYQPEGSIRVKAKRYAKRHPGVTIEEAARLLQGKRKSVRLPYIQMKSLSRGGTFSLFIKKRVEEESALTECGTYGLSNNRTVPEF